MFRILGFGFRVLEFGVWGVGLVYDFGVLDFVFRVYCFELRVLVFRDWV